MRNIFPVLACIVAFFLLSHPAQAANEIIGTIIEIEGEVLIKRGDAEAELAEIETGFALNDVIQTSEGGRALLLFVDETEITLSENSSFKVDGYAYSPENPATNSGKFNLLRGTFYFVSGLINKHEDADIDLNTPYGSIGIRGTTVWAGDIDEMFSVLVVEGEVTVTTERGRIKVMKDQGTTLRDARAIPTRPKIWPAVKVERALNNVKLARADQARQRIQAMKKNMKSGRIQMKRKAPAPKITPEKATELKEGSRAVKEAAPLKVKALKKDPVEAIKLEDKTKATVKEAVKEKAVRKRVPPQRVGQDSAIPAEKAVMPEKAKTPEKVEALEKPEMPKKIEQKKQQIELEKKLQGKRSELKEEKQKKIDEQKKAAAIKKKAEAMQKEAAMKKQQIKSMQKKREAMEKDLDGAKNPAHKQEMLEQKLLKHQPSSL